MIERLIDIAFISLFFFVFLYYNANIKTTVAFLFALKIGFCRFSALNGLKFNNLKILIKCLI